MMMSKRSISILGFIGTILVGSFLIYQALDHYQSATREKVLAQKILKDILVETEISEANLANDVLAQPDLEALIAAYRVAAEQLAKEHGLEYADARADKTTLVHELLEKFERQVYEEGLEQGIFRQSLEQIPCK